ncbi:MAG: MATE family efflux transporter [Firmicutes bacterium]|nr:MATE family efflux transporter [Bacillota bacterium]
MSKREEISLERHQMMLEMPAGRLIIKMAIPTIIAMVVDSLYNLADTFFVSSIGVNATAAVAVNDAFMHILMAISAAFAFGIQSYGSRLLGAMNDERASKAASTTVFIGILTSFFFVLTMWPLRRGLSVLFGSTDVALKYAVDYSTYILLAFPFTMMTNILNQLLKSEGNTMYAMIGTVSGCVINCILDPIFIWYLKLEVAGAAQATAISKVISFIVLVLPYLRKKTVIHLSPKLISFNRQDFAEVVKIGIPTFLRMFLMTFGSILTNRMARLYGTAVLAAVSIANKIYRFISSTVNGYAHGFTPCAGYCWGAKAYKRTKKLFYVTCLIGCAVGAVMTVVMYVFAGTMIGWFNSSNDPMVYQIGIFKIRFLCIGLIPHIFTMVTNSFYQALGKPVGNTILGLSRQLIFLIPMVLILPRFFAEYGVAAAQGVSDVLAALFIAIPFAIAIIRFIDREEKNQEQEVVEDN